MPRVLNDFLCADCGVTKEYFEDNNATTVVCLECDGVAKKVQRPIRSSLDPHDKGFPGARMKWENQRYRKMAEERKDSGYDPSEDY